jgi:two-component system response regulator AtoC
MVHAPGSSMCKNIHMKCAIYASRLNRSLLDSHVLLLYDTPMNYTVLVVDDELEMCLSLSELLKARGFGVVYTTNPSDVYGIFNEHKIDLIIMDIRMPEIGGLNLLKQLRVETHNIPVIMISGYPSVENIVSSMKYGALNFYKKPLNLPKLLDEITTLKKLKMPGEETPDVVKLETGNPRMLEIIERIKKIAPTSASVIISGESGTGKALAASAIHRLSSRRGGPFFKLNCAAIPHALLESELFGYEEGAFTDAKRLHRGKFELADGGSLFLDEIGDMSQEVQAKVLRVIEEKEFERLGGNEVLKVDVRLISATNKNLKEMTEKCLFREDLYYRLSVINIELPPLRERSEDIALLATSFLKTFSKNYGKEIRGISEAVRRMLCAHDWPGNVRELRNCIERAVIFCEGDEIAPDDLPWQYEDRVRSADPVSLDEACDSTSKRVILEALRKANGVKRKAAELLHIHRKTLYNKMKKLGMS